MNYLNIGAYVNLNAPQLFQAGREAYLKKGRGSLLCFPQRDNGNGCSSVGYLTEDMLREDKEPSLSVVERYDTRREVVFILAMDHPRGIYTYRIRSIGNTYDVTVAECQGVI